MAQAPQKKSWSTQRGFGIIWQVSHGSDLICLRKAFHEPDLNVARSAEVLVDAYGSPLPSCADLRKPLRSPV